MGVTTLERVTHTDRVVIDLWRGKEGNGGGKRDDETLKRWREGSWGGAGARFPVGYSAISEAKSFKKTESRRNARLSYIVLVF